MFKLLLAAILFLGPGVIQAQQYVTGTVLGNQDKSSPFALSGANVFWLNSQTGTITREDGSFKIPYSSEFSTLIFSYVGYESDSVRVTSPSELRILLNPSNELDEIELIKEREAVQKAFYSTQNVVTINSAELLKAACCNLSESFETNPAIDVNYNDALTGTKQIQMLGLTSPYLLITQENIPMVRGASQAYGLTFTPGTWIESIQISKGAGSVVNGFESLSGQINTELVKPLTDPKLFLNGYANLNGRLELNTHLRLNLSEKWNTGIYVHANKRSTKVDNNEDGFLDVPLADQINILNRWQYQNPEKGWVSFFNVRFLRDDKQVGQTVFNPDTDRFGREIWGSEIETQRFDSSFKLGYVFPNLPFQSIGFQAAYSDHQQDSYFGLNRYDITHESSYVNLLFNSILGNTKNKFKTGINFSYDGYTELANQLPFSRVDRSFGGFFEYNYEDLEKLSFTAGVRLDNHNNLGTFITPRFHIRYTPWETASIKASIGRGRRAANIFAENQQLFATSRQISLQNTSGSIYGLDPEDAWNYGISFLQRFTIGERAGSISADFYRTDFVNQIVVDWENPLEISFSNLEGESFANSFQLEFNLELLDDLELRTAYKNYNVKTTYQTGLLQKPLQPEHRYFANLGYNSPMTDSGSQWRFDYTLHVVGRQRLPDTSSSPPEFRLDEFSQSYALMNTQITRVFSSKWELYVGIENITNFRQRNPIISVEDPFGPNFDTSIVFAPILGRMYYTGFRYRLN